jgi:excisionase family DNA binding protein
MTPNGPSPLVAAVQPNSSLGTAEQLAERWSVPKAHVYRLAREGRIPVVLIGRYQRFRPASIEAWESAQERSADG